jgi:MFS family permease
VFGANVLSWLGDYLAKAAITALVFDRTGSVALSAVAFAISFLPWLTGGPVLAALAERHQYRKVMVICDVLRAGLMALIAIPGMPVSVMLALLFATSLANPPFQAARSALLLRS